MDEDGLLLRRLESQRADAVAALLPGRITCRSFLAHLLEFLGDGQPEGQPLEIRAGALILQPCPFAHFGVGRLFVTGCAGVETAGKSPEATAEMRNHGPNKFSRNAWDRIGKCTEWESR